MLSFPLKLGFGSKPGPDIHTKKNSVICEETLWSKAQAHVRNNTTPSNKIFEHLLKTTFPLWIAITSVVGGSFLAQYLAIEVHPLKTDAINTWKNNNIMINTYKKLKQIILPQRAMPSYPHNNSWCTMILCLSHQGFSDWIPFQGFSTNSNLNTPPPPSPQRNTKKEKRQWNQCSAIHHYHHYYYYYYNKHSIMAKKLCLKAETNLLFVA